MRPRGAEDVEGVLGVGQVRVGDGRLRHRPQFLDERMGLGHGDQGVVAAVQNEERWGVGPHMVDR